MGDGKESPVCLKTITGYSAGEYSTPDNMRVMSPKTESCFNSDLEKVKLNPLLQHRTKVLIVLIYFLVKNFFQAKAPAIWRAFDVQLVGEMNKV